MGTKKEEKEEAQKELFNEGRLNCDKKWKDAIDKRIEELEIQVGIPELRKLKSKVAYKWQ